MNRLEETKKEYARPVVRTKEVELGVFGDYSDTDCDRRHHRGRLGNAEEYGGLGWR